MHTPRERVGPIADEVGMLGKRREGCNGIECIIQPSGDASSGILLTIVCPVVLSPLLPSQLSLFGHPPGDVPVEAHGIPPMMGKARWAKAHSASPHIINSVSTLFSRSAQQG